MVTLRSGLNPGAGEGTSEVRPEVPVPSVPASGNATVDALIAALRVQQDLMQEQYAARQLPVVQPVVEDRMAKVLKEFKVLKPPVFGGGTDPVVADTWLREVGRLLDDLQMVDEKRVVLATRQLEGKAIHWWDSVLRLRNPDAGAWTWEQFTMVFVEKFFPDSVRDRMETQFLALFQGPLSVADYESKFSELARYAPHQVDSEFRRAKRFVHGLNPAVRGRLSALVFTDYGEACRRALAVELELEESRALYSQRAEKTGDRDRGKKRRREDRRPQRQQQQQVQGPPPPRVQGGQQQRPRGACFTCGSLEHQRNACPVWLQRQAAPAAQPQQQRAPQAQPAAPQQ
jgi:hypothetical protein